MKKLQVKVHTNVTGQHALHLLVDGEVAMVSGQCYEDSALAEHEAVALRSRLGINRVFQVTFPGTTRRPFDFESESMATALTYVAQIVSEGAGGAGWDKIIKVVDVT
jgi:hypothetical protein